MSRPQFLSSLSVTVSILLLAVLMCAGSTAQTESLETNTPSAKFQLLYTFTGGSDGYAPNGLTFDVKGALYGTTSGGATGVGTVFQLKPEVGGGWTLNTIHSFAGGPSDVGYPSSRVVFDRKGSLYGTGSDGGPNACIFDSCGGIFEISPSQTGWSETLIFSFNTRSGGTPYAGLTPYKDLFYGATEFGPESHGNVGNGTAFTIALENGSWKHKIIHAFAGPVNDGSEPISDLIFDKNGNVYGSTISGGTNSFGTIFKLTPNGKGGWSEELLYSFPSSYVGGAFPSDLVLDSSGNLYGVTASGGKIEHPECAYGGCGTVFELKHSKMGWRHIILYEFAGGSDGYSPDAGLVFDSAGNLYGTTVLGGNGTCIYDQIYPGCGTVFKLRPAAHGQWHKTILHNFTGGSDGEYPNYGTLLLNDTGHLYGTTFGGAGYGGSGSGTIYQVTP
jgi:uncharacterized repeat protein (TIGR03803 family)